jgi:hypothetical protein
MACQIKRLGVASGLRGALAGSSITSEISDLGQRDAGDVAAAHRSSGADRLELGNRPGTPDIFDRIIDRLKTF